LKYSQIHRIKSKHTESMINQAQLVNRTPVKVEENRARPAVSMIPQMAIRPVKMSAMSSNGFLNTVSSFRYIKENFINSNYYWEIVKKRVSHSFCTKLN